MLYRLYMSIYMYNLVLYPTENIWWTMRDKAYFCH